MGLDDMKILLFYFNIRKFLDFVIMKFLGCSFISNWYGEGWGIICKIEEDNFMKEFGFIKFFIVFLFILMGFGFSNILILMIFY